MMKITKLIGVTAALFASSAAWASDGSWTISDADGQVTVTRADKPLYGAKGTVLKAGDVISTSKTARAVLVRDGKFVVVEPGKKVRISKPTEKGAMTRIFEYLGNIVSTSSPRNSFNEQTAAAVVKGYDKDVEKSLSTTNKATYNAASDSDDPAMWKEMEPQTVQP
ncbi:hypothetical protein [Erythrobacter sp. YT30]|uniref:hypothetical protein n=1 Tax=Erythrobacter sp. YT30 TaxID=1735012 RepID=UPI00076CF94C|nr:hypothetical protein [Erythrobacter sp. YT30]KWV92693.1 hypothetical protein AUC45_00510 [Erythrobacter sp. YT30]